MGIHERIPWPAFAILAAAMVLSIAGLRLALGLSSPHAKLGFGLFARPVPPGRRQAGPESADGLETKNPQSPRGTQVSRS